MKNYLNQLFTAFLAVVFGLSLTACSSDDEKESQQPGILYTDLIVEANFSQDLLDLMTPTLQLTVSDPTKLSSTTKTLNKPENKNTLTATKFPASYEAPITVKTKALPENMKSSYTLSYDISYTLVAYRDGGIDEVITEPTNGKGGHFSITFSAISKEGLQQVVDQIKKSIEEECNVSIKNIQASNGKVIFTK